eukprot:TRINITY_DN1154_c0_g1_i1.p1 TRINITY_DN1154_c0_g1~~TRINITY_DN1154_c0_g1_i1.p1  ORF type:complete len:377 (-),score=108.76 TRINITY_DN1154_c0_g1_i1:17-1147(-)
MNLLCWNVNGIRAVTPKLNSLNVFFKKHSASIVCFQESKVSCREDLPDNIYHVDGYESFWSYSKTKKGYSGVVTYVKKGMTVSAEDRPLGIEEFDDEGRIIMTDHSSFVLFNVYFPNAGRGEHRLQYKTRFCNKFSELCEKYIKLGRHVVVVGDVNTAHTEKDTHRADAKSAGFLPEERKWLSEFLGVNDPSILAVPNNIKFIDTFRALHPEEVKYSWWDPRTGMRPLNRGWRLDYCLVSEGFLPHIVDSDILCSEMGSDHCPLFLSFKEEPKFDKPPPIHSLSSEYNRKIQKDITSFFLPKSANKVDDKKPSTDKENESTSSSSSTTTTTTTTSTTSTVTRKRKRSDKAENTSTSSSSSKKSKKTPTNNKPFEDS